MPPRSRTGTQPLTASAATGIEDTIQKAYYLVPSTDPASIKQLWEELCQKHLDALRIGITHETFPYWILRNIPHEAIQKMIDVVYDKGARKIEAYAPKLLTLFGVPQWQCVLFLGRLPQNKVKLLYAIAKNRKDLTLDSLYRELCRVRTRKGTLPDGPFDFRPAEFKSCFQNSHTEDEDEGISDDDYQNGDEMSCDVIRVVGSSEDDYNSDSESNISGSSVNYELSPDLSSCVTDIRDGHGASPIHATSSTLEVIPAILAPATQETATHNALSFITQQLDQSRRGQPVPLGVLGAGRLPDSEPITDTVMPLGSTLVTMQRPTSYTNNTTGDRPVAVRNDANLVSTVIDSLRTLDEELKQGQDAIVREEAEILEEVGEATEVAEAAGANLSRLVALDRKHRILTNKRQEHQAKRLKFDTEVQEITIRVKELRQGIALVTLGGEYSVEMPSNTPEPTNSH